MNSKLEDLMRQCAKDGAPSDSCTFCTCSKRACLLNLLEQYNDDCDETEIINYDR